MANKLGSLRKVEQGIRNGLPAKEPERGLEGIAHGGPRHGIKLTAGLRWDGAVAMSRAEARQWRLSSNYMHYHFGRYEWQPLFSFTDYTWVWVPGESPKKPVQREREAKK